MTPAAEAAPAGAPALEIAVIQLTSGDDLGQNLETSGRLVRAAAARGAGLVLLPENFAYFGPEAGRRAHAERLGDFGAPIQRALSDMARAAGVVVVAGGMPEASGVEDRPFNTALVLDAEGAIAASYRKIHLFDVDLADGTALRESASTLPGHEPRTFRAGGLLCGLSICYDLRFPELYRRLAAAGAELLLVPSAFTLHTGKDHWHVLLRARAIENQCFVAAAAQWGRHPHGRSTYGHSLVVDPWGTVIAECSDGVGFTRATIERARISAVREQLPCLEHVRLR